MPIDCPVAVRPLYQEEFAHLDERIMRHVLASRETLGRLCEPSVYRTDLAARLTAAGIEDVRQQVPITLSHRDFTKTLRLDLIVEDSAVYELRAEPRLTPEQETRFLTGLSLYGAHYGKLLNFQPAHLETKFVHSELTPPLRHELGADMRRWQEDDPASERLRSLFVELLDDWGGFLDPPLYVEALTHLLGGDAKVMRSIELHRDGALLGHQQVHLAGPDTAFHLTAIPEGPEHFEPHLQALLRHSSLTTFLWVNLAGQRIQFVTLNK